MNTRKLRTSPVLLSTLLALTVAAHADLKHRYSFNEASGTVAKDSVGGGDGTLLGGASLSGGKVTLDGNDGYVDLPNGIISILTDATFETWGDFQRQRRRLATRL